MLSKVGRRREVTSKIRWEGARPLGGEHTVQRLDDVLYNCTPGTHVTLITSVTPIHLIKEVKVKWLRFFC